MKGAWPPLEASADLSIFPRRSTRGWPHLAAGNLRLVTLPANELQLSRSVTIAWPVSWTVQPEGRRPRGSLCRTATGKRSNSYAKSGFAD